MHKLRSFTHHAITRHTAATAFCLIIPTVSGGDKTFGRHYEGLSLKGRVYVVEGLISGNVKTNIFFFSGSFGKDQYTLKLSSPFDNYQSESIIAKFGDENLRLSLPTNSKDADSVVNVYVNNLPCFVGAADFWQTLWIMFGFGEWSQINTNSFPNLQSYSRGLPTDNLRATTILDPQSTPDKLILSFIDPEGSHDTDRFEVLAKTNNEGRNIPLIFQREIGSMRGYLPFQEAKVPNSKGPFRANQIHTIAVTEIDELSAKELATPDISNLTLAITDTRIDLDQAIIYESKGFVPTVTQLRADPLLANQVRRADGYRRKPSALYP